MLDENVIADLVRRKVVSDTFRRLMPDKKLRAYRTAVRLFGEYGYDGLAVDEYCREAGISKGSFFQYFPSKSHLLEFAILIFDDYLLKWVSEIRRQETAVRARSRIQYLYHALVVNSKLHSAEQKFFLFVTHALNHAGVAIEGIELDRHIADYVSEIISRGEETGEIRGDFDVELTSYLVSVILGGMIQRQFSQRRIHAVGVGEYLVSFLFDGISAT
jgi:AcrR family transcriptional regulator